MRKILKNSKGITLIALVITIVILLILAGISISALTQTGLFGRAKQAEQVSKEKQEEENATLGTYENEIDKYLGDNNKKVEGKIADRVNDGTIKIGDYVKYTPDAVNSTAYNKLISDFGTYSGSTANTTSTLTQETTLNWRVLDVTDDGQVRLISDKPTTSKITLQGYNGYNNAVKLLDDACSTLYTNKQLANKVQNIKIEDITKHMTTQPPSGKEYTPTDIKYPKILEQEENQTVENSTTENKLGPSSQNAFVIGWDESATSTVKMTDWYKSKETSDWEEGYYELFINNGSDYYPYWMSSRCVNAYSNRANCYVRFVDFGNVNSRCLYTSNGKEYTDTIRFRPIITLNSNVQIDTANSGGGNTAAQGYAIK